MLKEVINSKSKTFLAFCFCFLAGIVIGSIYNKPFDPYYLYLSLFISILFLLLTWQNKATRVIILGLTFVALGFARYVLAFPSDSPQHISSHADETKTVVGYVAAEPDMRMDGVRYVVEMQNAKVKMQNEEGKGKIYVKAGLYPRYVYGDVLEVTCELEKPMPINDFRYDMYLARLGVFVLCNDPEIEKVGTGEGNIVMRDILWLKQRVADRISNLWHEPHASFMAGLLYGYRGGLGDLNEDFNRTGVSHIVAISGYNITIIAAILVGIFISIGVPRKKAFWGISFGIVLFVIFVGANATVVRAGIMGVVALLARQVGRLSRVANLMALAAVLMTLHNPFVLVWDAGFQLSFLATLGLVYLSPIVREWFTRVPEFIGLRESGISTISAIIATLPLMMYQFGRLSIVAPIVNVLILWIIPWVMMFGFAAVLSSFLIYPVGQVIAWVTWAGLQYVVSVVRWFADLPFAAVDMQIPLWIMLCLYGLMIYLVNRLRKVNGTQI